MRRARDARPNILLVSMDTTRSDHLSAYGYPRRTTPRLEKLAAQGVRFDTAYSPSATTAPTHASLFTGRYPITHGVSKNGYPLSPRFETLAELLSNGGFETAGIVSSYVLTAKFGLGRGFDLYDEDFSEAMVPQGVTLWEGHEVEGKFYGSADDTTRRALDFLETRSQPERPFFLFVHYFDPHDPYLPPPGYEPPFRPGRKEALKLKRTIFLYDTLIAFTDQEIGRLLDGLTRLGLEEDTIVIVTGDHGEGLMQHGHMRHGLHIYEESVRVPLIVRWPGRLEAGRVVGTPVEILDLTRTILEMAGLDAASGLQGRSLVGLLSGRESGDEERAIHLYRRFYAEGVTDGIYAKGEKFGIRVGRWKLIEGPDEGTVELFDLSTDPMETRNLAPDRSEIVRSMTLRLQAWRRENESVREELPAISDEDRARLEALGYVE